MAYDLMSWDTTGTKKASFHLHILFYTAPHHRHGYVSKHEYQVSNPKIEVPFFSGINTAFLMYRGIWYHISHSNVPLAVNQKIYVLLFGL